MTFPHMTKACIFDFDGVMIESERYWEDDEAKKLIYKEVYGVDIAEKLNNKTLGLNMDAIHALAKSYVSTVPIQHFYDACDRKAQMIYAHAPLTKGLDEVIDKLIILNIALGIVSASPKLWIDTALKRLKNASTFHTVISLHERSDLAHKPAPDGYNEAMRTLGVTPHDTIVIEDSNTGIASAKAAGVFTIGLRQNLVAGYTIEGADAYVEDITNVLQFV